MDETEMELPQLYLITPAEFDLTVFPDQLAKVLDTHETACLRLSLATSDEGLIQRSGDALREVAHARDVPIVITEHALMVDRLGLDGVHLTDGPRRVRKLREELGSEAIIGAYCSASRHDGLSAGEAGADYVSFGPAGSTNLGDGTQAPEDLFDWWSKVVEVPVVAEGALAQDIIKTLSTMTDFFAIGEEIWRQDDPSAALGQLMSAIDVAAIKAAALS